MKKLLLLTYFFPPANFAGSYRVASFAKYLHQFGWYPVVVTRQFRENTANFRDLAYAVGDEVVHEQHDGYEVYRLPYRGNWRDRLFARYGDTKFVWLRKILTLIELIGQNFTTLVVPYRNLYTFSLKLLRQQPDIQLVLASGNPYQLFHFCYLLHRKTGIPWVADYRDEWKSDSGARQLPASFFSSLIDGLESRSEKRWGHSAKLVVSVTESWAKRIAAYLDVKQSASVANGFEEELLDIPYQPRPDSLHIGFVGSAYPNQPFLSFFEAVAQWISHQTTDRPVHFHFFGAAFDPSGFDVLEMALKRISGHFTHYPRMPKRELMQHFPHLDAFLILGYENQTGRHSAKVFDYLALGRKVLLYPDYQEIGFLLTAANLGLICPTPASVGQALTDLAKTKKESGKIVMQPQWPFIQSFSRREQVRTLAAYLDR